jgi:ParB family transcriptional regulator, chromosome partitioning protein
LKKVKTMIANGSPVSGLDVPIVKLVPRHERTVSAKHRQRIEASLRAVGLLEPLIVWPLGDGFEILDGCLRYRILLDWGVESVPCLLGKAREAYTGNRMVNPLSASQEMKMLRKSLEELDEKTIAGALGMAGIGHRLNPTLLKKLDPKVAAAFDAGKLTLPCAKEFVLVKFERQREILGLMEQYEDYSATFAKGLVLKTSAGKRQTVAPAKAPWEKAGTRKQNLLNKLREAEQQQEFYAGLYRQYSTNLLKLVIFVRALLGRPRTRAYMQEKHSRLLEELARVVESVEG